MCDEVLVLQHGRVVDRGNPASLFREPRQPYTRALLDAMPTMRCGSMRSTSQETTP
jgi:peptide/nickel transport system ATP-binding protein